MKRLWLAWDWDGACTLFTSSPPVFDCGLWRSSEPGSTHHYIGALNSKERAETCVELVEKEEQ